MKIKCAAIRTKSGQVFEGRSHANCFQAIRQEFPVLPWTEQGFVTDTGEFVDRKEAGRIAFEAGQIKKQEDALLSEDLTGDWYWKKEKNGKDAQKT